MWKIFEEYGMKLNVGKSRVVVLAGEVLEQESPLEGGVIKRYGEAKYLGVKLKEVDGLVTTAENAKSAGSLIGMIKYSAKRSGGRFVIGREAWKSMVVSRMMYAAGAVGWSVGEREKAERMQREVGRWLWRVEKSVRNGVVHGETGWSSFWEREAKVRVAFMCRVLEGSDFVAMAGRLVGWLYGVLRLRQH